MPQIERRSNVLPWKLVDQARSQSRDTFVGELGETKLLVVRVGDAGGELERGLMETVANSSGAWHPRSGVTGVGTVIAPISEGFVSHASVSKVHAWFEWDEDGNIYLCDEGSTNNTQLNGRVLMAGELEPFVPGDLIRFGDVEAFLCLPETLWEALDG
jgi:hypothetical protein